MADHEGTRDVSMMDADHADHEATRDISMMDANNADHEATRDISMMDANDADSCRVLEAACECQLLTRFPVLNMKSMCSNE